MKIRCDVCEKVEASVFCTADEAALCNGCDHHVHHANKLASQHKRFSLLHPTFKQSPLCDICQEKRAFVFCKEDRSVLCRECDVSTHKANEHTKKHNRFLLTGVKLSSSSSFYPTTSTCNPAIDAETGSFETQAKRPKTNFSESHNAGPVGEGCSYSTSSISEYLTETLPGWCVEDLLDPSSFGNGFCKLRGNDNAKRRMEFWWTVDARSPTDIENSSKVKRKLNQNFRIPFTF